MKISNSKHQLARLLIEAGVKQFPDRAIWAAQDKRNPMEGGCSGVTMYSSKPTKPEAGVEWWNKGQNVGSSIAFIKSSTTLIPNWHQTTLSRAEFDLIVAETVPDADGWIEWKGGECQVERGTLVDVKYVNGVTNTGVSALTHEWDMLDIVAYRLHKPEQSTVESRLAAAVDIVKAAAPALMSEEMKFTGDEVMGEHRPEQAKPEYCESVTRSIPEPTAAPTLDQLLQDWRSADDFAQRKQAEAEEAAAMRDERWQAVQARAGEMCVTVVDAARLN